MRLFRGGIEQRLYALGAWREMPFHSAQRLTPSRAPEMPYLCISQEGFVARG
jgi:hypothetical protein